MHGIHEHFDKVVSKIAIKKQFEPLLLIGPESFTYASDRSKIDEIFRLKAFRESSEPEYPGEKLDTFNTVIGKLLDDKPVKRFGVAGLSVITDSLSAIKHAKVTPIKNADGLIESFDVEGEFPMYGNDDDRVDEIAADLVKKFMKRKCEIRNNKLSEKKGVNKNKHAKTMPKI